MRDLPPFGPPFLPPRLPISRITREIVSSFTPIVYRQENHKSEFSICMLEALVVKDVMLEAVLAWELYGIPESDSAASNGRGLPGTFV
jgi:hypothetical protein